MAIRKYKFRINKALYLPRDTPQYPSRVLWFMPELFNANTDHLNHSATAPGQSAPKQQKLWVFSSYLPVKPVNLSNQSFSANKQNRLSAIYSFATNERNEKFAKMQIIFLRWFIFFLFNFLQQKSFWRNQIFILDLFCNLLKFCQKSKLAS